jgi:hypothetical protein
VLLVFVLIGASVLTGAQVAVAHQIVGRPAGPSGRGRICRPGSTLGGAQWVRCRNSAT